jgi:hypothetical protein
VRGCAGAAAGLLATLVLGACGTGATRTTASATTSPAATSTAADGGTGAGATGTSASADTAVGTGTGTASSTGTVTQTSTARGRKAKGRKANDLPPAPPGLSQTAGYATYERCQGTCTGSVPAALRRPLKLPSADGGPCPITLNAQPASTGRAPAGVGFRGVSGSPWTIAEATWRVPASYSGPLLIRGAMLGGGALGFGTGPVPYDELQLFDAGQGAPRVAGGGRAWITYTRVRSAGCYAYQVDGTSFSEVVVFRAVG